MEVKKENVLYSFRVQNEKASVLPIAIFSGINIALIVYFSYAGNYLAALIFALTFIIAVGLFLKNKTKITNYKMRREGIQVDNTLYPYDTLKSFWIFTEASCGGALSSTSQRGEQSELSIKSKKSMAGYIRMPINKSDEQKIRRMLSEFIPEKKHKESMSNAFMKILGL